MKIAVRSALRRMAIIDEKLRARSWPNASTLAHDLEVTPRTIHRDIEYLRDQRSAPIAFDPRKNGYYYTEPGFRLPYFTVSEGECVALFLAERLLQQYRGTAFAGDISHLFHKVVTLLTEPVSINLQHLSEAVSFRQRSAEKNELFTKIDPEKKAKFGPPGLNARITTSDDNKTITAINVVTFGGGKGKDKDKKTEEKKTE